MTRWCKSHHQGIVLMKGTSIGYYLCIKPLFYAAFRLIFVCRLCLFWSFCVPQYVPQSWRHKSTLRLVATLKHKLPTTYQQLCNLPTTLQLVGKFKKYEDHGEVWQGWDQACKLFCFSINKCTFKFNVLQFDHKSILYCTGSGSDSIFGYEHFAFSSLNPLSGKA